MAREADSPPMSDLPTKMTAVYLTGHGGFEKLEYRNDVPVPTPGPNEIVLRVGAAGVNNTDINTRIGWYSKSVTSGTGTGGDEGYGEDVSDDGGWAGEGLNFPRVQGADAAGTIVAVGSNVDSGRLGQRVLVRSMQTTGPRDDANALITMGSEIDGGFAQYCCVASREAFEIRSDLTDIELASFPCAYSTAEAMLHRVGLADGETVLITGASGGVGSAAVQLAKRRGATVIGVASQSKWDEVRALGADRLLGRDADVVAELGRDSLDVVVDVVAGPTWPALLDVLRRQGRYVCAGAIAGPIVELDVRTLYLKDLTLLGSTYQPREVFENLVRYIERGEIVPIIAATYPLEDIVRAQEDFLAKSFAGKLVLVPPAD
ncbi:MAG: NADPH:quinone reductase-like Zn-dependent oxidoreductase [Candidatus Aldehydirespiratoraceae bacterium]|jgi:NADPH:quinone reductase-like Zn-dependent oxidoreductase